MRKRTGEKSFCKTIAAAQRQKGGGAEAPPPVAGAVPPEGSPVPAVPLASDADHPLARVSECPLQGRGGLPVGGHHRLPPGGQEGGQEGRLTLADGGGVHPVDRDPTGVEDGDLVGGGDHPCVHALPLDLGGEVHVQEVSGPPGVEVGGGQGAHVHAEAEPLAVLPDEGRATLALAAGVGPDGLSESGEDWSQVDPAALDIPSRGNLATEPGGDGVRIAPDLEDPEGSAGGDHRPDHFPLDRHIGQTSAGLDGRRDTAQDEVPDGERATQVQPDTGHPQVRLPLAGCRLIDHAHSKREEGEEPANPTVRSVRAAREATTGLRHQADGHFQNAATRGQNPRFSHDAHSLAVTRPYRRCVKRTEKSVKVLRGARGKIRANLIWLTLI